MSAIEAKEALHDSEAPAERHPLVEAGKKVGEFMTGRLNAAKALGGIVAKGSYHIREVPLEYDMRPRWKYRLHTAEAPT